jgi:hypothetical protein
MSYSQALSFKRPVTALLAGSSLILASVLATAGISNASTDTDQADTTVAADASVSIASDVGVDGAALSGALKAVHDDMAAKRQELRDTLDEQDGEQWRDGMHAIATERRDAMADVRAEFGLGVGNGDVEPSDRTVPPAHANAQAHTNARVEHPLNGNGDNGNGNGNGDHGENGNGNGNGDNGEENDTDD